MSTTQSRISAIILPDDGGVGGDDDIDVTAQISNSFDLLANHIGIPHVANFAALPATNLYTGRLCQTDSDGVVYQYIAGTGWVLDHDTVFQAYTPSWTGVGGTGPAIGNGSLIGRSFRVGKLCNVTIRVVAGSTTTFGSGTYYQFSLPYNRSANDRFEGFGGWLTESGATNRVLTSVDQASLNVLSMVDGSGATGPTTPLTLVQPNARISIRGFYEMA